MSQNHQPECKVSGINLIESSHHDLGWHKGCYDAEAAFTFDEINTALDLMQTDPDFTWTHECAGYLYQYLKAFPERREELTQRIAEGRFDAGAGYTMPYTSFVTSEMLVRQFIYGKKWVEDTFPGYESKVYYNTDIPGFGVQMPQLMKKAGVPYLYASRSWNFEGIHFNAFQQMEALDHSKIQTFFMHHYTDNLLCPPDQPVPVDNYDTVQKRIREYQEDAEACRLGAELPLLYSMDCTLPVDFAERFQKWNAYAEEHHLPKMKYSTMQAAIESVFAENCDLEAKTLTGEWPNKWFYENAASDHETFLKQREADRFLRGGETLAVLRAIVTGSFAAYPSEKIEEAWRAADHACHGYAPEGSIEDFRKTYQKAYDLAKDVYEEGMHWLVQAVRTDRSKGEPVVISNPLSRNRTEPVLLDLPAGLAEPFRVVDAEGKEVPHQLTDSGELLFLAEEVPSLGWKTYYLRAGEASAVSGGSYPVGTAWTAPYSNDFYTVSPVISGGALESVIDRENGDKSLFSAEKFKIGELYDFQYDGMGAGEQYNMWQPYDGMSQLSRFGGWKCTESGPVRTVFESEAPAMSRGPAVLRFTVYETVKRLDFDVKLDLDAEGSRQLRLMFPVNAGEMFGADDLPDRSKVRVTYEVPFGALDIGQEMLPKFASFNHNQGDPNHVGGGASRPEEFTENNACRPREVQNWIEASDSEQDFSVTFSSYNLGWDYQDACADPVRTPVLQPVLISTSKSCHWLYGKWLQPGTHAFHFSMTSGTAADTAGRYQNIGVNHPLDARMQAESGELLPETGALLAADCGHVMVTAVKKAEDDDRHIIIRWYETEGREETAPLTLSLPGTEITCAERVSLIEAPAESGDVKAEGCRFTAPVKPWSVETVRIALANL